MVDPFLAHLAIIFGSKAEFCCRTHIICLGGCWPLEFALFFELQSHEAVAACVWFPNSKVLAVDQMP